LAGKLGLLSICLLIAIISSYKLLAVPDLKPGDIATFDATATTEGLVPDSEALTKKRSELLRLTFVQVIDKDSSERLQSKLIEQLKDLETYTKANDLGRVFISLTNEEKNWLLNRNEGSNKEWDEEILTVSKRMLSQGLIKTLAIDQLQQSAALQLNKIGEKNSPAVSIGSKLIAKTFQGNSNLRHDSAKSQKLFEEQITKQGIPTHPLVKTGDLIIKKGEIITQKRYDILAHFGLINRSPRPIEWSSKFIEAFASPAILILIMRREKPRLTIRQALLALGLLLIVQVSKIWFGSAISPLAIIVPPTLLLSQGIGTNSSLAWMAIASLLWPVPIAGIGEGRLIVASVAATFVAFIGGKMRNRAQLLQIVVLLPFISLSAEWFLFNQFSSSKSLGNFNQNAESLITEALLVGAMLMFTILLIPIIENTFGLLTKARLMELADKEKPLLRRLSREAPGTFEHTLMICGLAEEGARSIGGDVDLIRTGSLYHDVGKLHAPQWFIENQEDGENPHDQLNDPFASAAVLQAHVDEGLKLARKHRLPAAIADFIPEHQGTLKMGYFLHQARKTDPLTSEEVFRYRGPIPQSKETAILMLADGCEAALRALEVKTTDKEANSTVRKIIKSRQWDGQLKESSLTRAEIELVVRAFVRVWKRMRHRRLQYPVNNNKGFD
tara:strand:- start:287 stop:2296 length:2010 start_codon:yes stop_codon:yes gene_type:complete